MLSNLAGGVPVVVCVHNPKELLLELQLDRPEGYNGDNDNGDGDDGNGDNGEGGDDDSHVSSTAVEGCLGPVQGDGGRWSLRRVTCDFIFDRLYLCNTVIFTHPAQ